MSVRVHPRIMRRRAQVREFGARSQLRRLLRLLVVVALAAALLWFAQSPVFSVAEVSISGSVEADVDQILAGAEVYVGRPLILIRTGRVEDALEADLWIKSAEVHRRFPNRVEVEIVERVEEAMREPGMIYHAIGDDGSELWMDVENEKFRRREASSDGSLTSVGDGWDRYRFDAIENQVFVEDANPEGPIRPRIDHPMILWLEALGRWPLGRSWR